MAHTMIEILLTSPNLYIKITLWKSKPRVITPPGRQSSVVSVSVCLCLSASISPELNVRSSPVFLHKLPIAVTRSFFGGVAICYVLPVFWLTSDLHTMGHMQACRFRCGEWRYRVVVRRLTPPLRRTVCVLTYRMGQKAGPQTHDHNSVNFLPIKKIRLKIP